MITIRRVLPVAVSFTLLLAACGGSSDGDAEVTESAPGTESATDDTEDFTEVDGTDPSDESIATDPAEPAATADPVATGPASDSPADSDPAAEPTDTTEDPAGADDTTAGAPAAAEVSMAEWAIEAPTEYSAGEITFTASNNGSFPHEFVVIAGEGYESLPLAEGGSVIEDELPTGALIGRTGRVAGGSSEDLTVTLAPGNYVFLCNLGGGGNSHAGQGQRLDVTVS